MCLFVCLFVDITCCSLILYITTHSGYGSSYNATEVPPGPECGVGVCGECHYIFDGWDLTMCNLCCVC